MAHTYTQLLYHIVFSTKERRPWLRSELRARLHRYPGGAIRKEGGVAIVVGGVEDHIHIFVRLRQDKSLSDIVRNIKANSPGWLHRNFSDLKDFAWQRGYSAFTVSHSQGEKVKRYVANQEKHHRKQSLQDELREMLRRHGVEFEEEHLWD
jgi:REP element-mobilizing transposase RayT